jgi:hypothetical protein
MALENLDESINITRDWDDTRECINTWALESLGYYELKQNKP